MSQYVQASLFGDAPKTDKAGRHAVQAENIRKRDIRLNARFDEIYEEMTSKMERGFIVDLAVIYETLAEEFPPLSVTSVKGIVKGWTRRQKRGK